MTMITGQRILIAEDEGLIALQVEELLLELGCIVVGPVSRVQDVIERLDNEQVDGAILDVNLRGGTIFSVLPSVIKLGLPFIISSGYEAESLFPPQFRSLPRVAKPFDEAELRRLCLATFGNR